MNIILIMPPHSFEDRYNKAIAKAAGSLPPLGLLYIAAVLKKEGYNVDVYDGSIKSYYGLIKKLDKGKYDLVGITTMTFLQKKIKTLIKKIKEINKDSFVVIGGAHATINKEKCAKEFEDVDAIIYGEGEYTMLEIARAIEKNDKLSNIKGIIYKKGGKIIVNKPRPLIKDLDELPFPARELINIHDYSPAVEQYKKKPVTNIITSRGCPFRCLFCIHTMGHSIRYRNPVMVVDEMEELVEKEGIKDFAIFDDTFCVDKKRVHRFCDELIKRKLNVIWSAITRVDSVEEELLKKMKKAGCWKIFYGVESILQKNLDMLRKGIKTEQIYKAIRHTKKADIECEASFIFGIPGETYQEAIETINKAIKLDPDYTKFFNLTPYGELYDNIDKYGKIVNKNIEYFHGNKVTFVPHSMTKKELEKLVPLAYKKFYLRPRYILNYIKRIKSINDVKRAIKGIMAVLSL